MTVARFATLQASTLRERRYNATVRYAAYTCSQGGETPIWIAAMVGILYNELNLPGSCL